MFVFLCWFCFDFAASPFQMISWHRQCLLGSWKRAIFFFFFVCLFVQEEDKWYDQDYIPHALSGCKIVVLSPSHLFNHFPVMFVSVTLTIDYCAARGRRENNLAFNRFLWCLETGFRHQFRIFSWLTQTHTHTNGQQFMIIRTKISSVSITPISKSIESSSSPSEWWYRIKNSKWALTKCLFLFATKLFNLIWWGVFIFCLLSLLSINDFDKMYILINCTDVFVNKLCTLFDQMITLSLILTIDIGSIEIGWRRNSFERNSF